MKTLINTLAVLVLLSLGACNSSAENNKDATKGDATKAKTETHSGDVTEKGAIKMTKADFLEKVMNYEKNASEWNYIGDKPALIDFYADWCGPCKIASPVLDELAIEYHGQIYVYKVDTDVERELASLFGIRSIPSFLFIPREGQPTMTSGIARTPEETKEMFRKMIDDLLLGEGESEV
jgi:thioredoxin